MKSLSIPAVTALIAEIVSSSVLAQQTPPVRIRGTIEKVDGATLMVKARDGSSVKVTLAENARVTAMVKAQLSDIKQGSFIGVTAMPQPDGSQKAIGLHIFMESQKGVVADRPSHLHGVAEGRRCRSAFPVGSRAGQHHDQRQCSQCCSPVGKKLQAQL